MNPLNLPRPAWMTEELVLLEDQADRFLKNEFVPHIEKWHEEKIFPARGLDQGRAGGPALLDDSRGIRWRRRHIRP
jgi:hypothetical protein